MLLKLTNHLQARLIERGFSVEELKEAIRKPDSKEEAGEGCIKIWKKLGSGKKIGVIYKKDGFRDQKNTYIIITAYYQG